MTVALNPSPMEVMLHSLLPLADYLLLNEIEAAQFLAGTAVPEGPEELAAALAERLPSTAVVLTLGPQGSLRPWEGANPAGGHSRSGRGHHSGEGHVHRLFPVRGFGRPERDLGHGIRLHRRGHRRHPVGGRALHPSPGGGSGGNGALRKHRSRRGGGPAFLYPSGRPERRFFRSRW